MSDDREREHCWRVAGDYLLRRWDCVIPDGWPNELADLIQEQRAAAAAEARDKALEDVDHAVAEEESAWLEMSGMGHPAHAAELRQAADACKKVRNRIRALRGGGR